MRFTYFTHNRRDARSAGPTGRAPTTRRGSAN